MFLFQIRINLNEKNNVMAIKDYLTNDLGANGPEPTGKGRRRSFFKRPGKNARRAFKQMNTLLREEVFGDRPNITNVCFLLVNEKKTSRYLKRSGINTFCDHILVLSGEDEFDLETVRKKICPEAQIVRGTD